MAVEFELGKVDRRLLIAGTKQELLDLLQTNKGKYFTLNDMVKHAREKHYWLWDSRAQNWLAWNNGIKGLITSFVHSWRRDGHTIVSSATKGRGYVYIDPNDPNSPRFWNSKFIANEKYREQIPISERKVDIELFKVTYRECESPQLKMELQKVAVEREISMD